ncbi:MAG: hypothetical protein WBG86_23200 [Polyangiales bacterium]
MLIYLRLSGRHPVVLTSILGVAMSFALGGCGDDANSAPQVVLEVQAPVSDQGTDIASLDYEIACDTAWDSLDDAGSFTPATRREGTFEPMGPAVTASGSEVPDFGLWGAAEEPLDGLCLLNLVARDDQQRFLCSGTETFQATDGESLVVDTVMDCTEFASFVGALSVDASVPDPTSADPLQTVEFTIACTGAGTAFFEGMDALKSEVRIDGNLEVNEDPGENRLTVEQSFLDLPTGLCTIQLRGRDDDGEVICSADEGFLIAPERTSTVAMVLVCNL